MTDEKRDSDDPESAGASEAASERTGGTEPTVVGGGRSRDPRVILDEMLDAIALIQRYTHGLSYAEFAAQQVLQDAVIPRIAILGAAATIFPSKTGRVGLTFPGASSWIPVTG